MPAVKPKSHESPSMRKMSGSNGPNGGTEPLPGNAEWSLTFKYWTCAPTPTLSQSVILTATVGLAFRLKTSDSVP